MEGRQGKAGAPVEAEALIHRSGSLIFIAQGRGLISVLHAATFQFLDIIKVGPLPRECRRVWARECVGVLPRLGLPLLRTRRARPGLGAPVLPLLAACVSLLLLRGYQMEGRL